MARPKERAIDPNHPYTREVLRHKRFLEQRSAQELAEEAERIRELPPHEQERLASLSEAQRIMAEQPAEPAVENDAQPNLSAAWQVDRRDGWDGPEWRGLVTVSRDGGDPIVYSTGWLPRARFLVEVVVIRKHFNAALFEGVGTPHVW